MKKLVAFVLAALIMVGLAQMALAIIGPIDQTATVMGYYTVKFVRSTNFYSPSGPLVPVATGKIFWLIDEKFNIVASGKTNAEGNIRYFVPTNRRYIGANDTNSISPCWPIQIVNNIKQVNTSGKKMLRNPPIS